MALRILSHEADEAGEISELLVAAGFGADVSRELFAGEDDLTEAVHVVTTDAGPEVVDELITDSEAWVELIDPMSGTQARVDIGSADLPDAPRRTHRPAD
ncbi:hypothetical protein ACQBAR_06890 [Propionibacteriaceae bacterium Y1685]|uniref:hypothetical protein n=1 Tax=Microlunatus sp. Y1700 TaxID=3418487 RepID=UPI003B7FC8A1